MLNPLIVIGIIAFIALIGWLTWYLKKRRREALIQAARQLGFKFARRDPFMLTHLPFELMKRGDGRGAENVMWGEWQGLDVREFDYWYYEESTDSQGHRTRSYRHFSCALTGMPIAAPHLSVSAENIFTKLADHMGLEDIQFESEEFNRRFNVKSRDPKFATDVVDGRMMEWLLSAGKEWSFELDGTRLLCYSRRRNPADLVPLLGTLKGFRDHIPDVARSLYGREASR